VTPTDALDPARFGQVVETTKDAFVEALRDFFAQTTHTVERRGELPFIEKYATTVAPDDPHTTAVNVFQRHPELFERMPMVVVMSAQGSQKPVSIGPPTVNVVQDPPRVRASQPGPYALVDGDVLEVRIGVTRRTAKLSQVIFSASQFPTANPITAATAADIARVINSQSPFFRAYVAVVGGQQFLELHARPSSDSATTPSYIEVSTATSANFASETGFIRQGYMLAVSAEVSPQQGRARMVISLPEGSVTSADEGAFITTSSYAQPYFNSGRYRIVSVTTTVGQPDSVLVEYRNAIAEVPIPPSTNIGTWFVGARDDQFNPARPPMMRYMYASDLSVQLSILANDELVRKELHDILNAFLSFFLEDRFFTFNGRTDVPENPLDPSYRRNESYQITIRQPVRHSGESEVQRPGDLNDRVYVGMHTVDVTTSWYIDRELYFDGTNTPRMVTSSMLVDGGGAVPLTTEVVESSSALAFTSAISTQGPPGPQGPPGTIIFDGGGADRGPGSIVFSLDLGGVT
jgi:hypothetical protein